MSFFVIFVIFFFKVLAHFFKTLPLIALRFGKLRPGKIKLKTACIFSFSKKVNGRPLDMIIRRSRNSNVGLSLIDIGQAQKFVMDCC
ncbi:hypothetical protein C1646_723786 [Rhizophagus diaphanus]|nr:hypothetical protein C1646_723786 [Rhizophagus diaphanus] [Rhizophagus sp. MUCL 43196]